jgi:hypothetical protein
MSKQLGLGTLGAPQSDERHHRLREIASLVAAACGGVAVLVVGFLLLGGTSAFSDAGTWVLLAALVAVWLSGIWWRWDSPDRRKRNDERERRGY